MPSTPDRYDQIPYRRCGRSGLLLPAISLGLWHNFGTVDVYETGREIIVRAFDLGITHFDLANNYGPVPGSAEETFGRVLARDLAPHRDELIISSKAGYRMWPGPYGEWGSRKYLLASLDQSLGRMGLDYVDIFYSHRPDPDTPVEETVLALDQAVRQGKALYAGLSNYSAEQTRAAVAVAREVRLPLVIHQPKYSMFERTPEGGLLDVLAESGIGAIAFSPLAQGLLTDRYLRDIPADSRAAKEHGALQAEAVTEARRAQLKALNDVAAARGQTLAQLAIAWVLRTPAVTSALIGASRVSQLEQNLAALDNLELSAEEQAAVERLLGSGVA